MHTNVERLLGRLVTDPALRARFARDADVVLAEWNDVGLELSALEIEALAATDPAALHVLAAALDPRLRRAGEPRHSIALGE